MKFCLISLGCAKNLVDSEVITGRLLKRGFSGSSSLSGASLAILNTCAFIQPASEEAIGRILELAEWKKERRGRKILVCGCLPERYREKLAEQFPEVDFWVGVHDEASIPDLIAGKERKPHGVFFSRAPARYIEEGPRIISTPRHWAYLKIAEGCSHRCTFCVIPAIRGNYRSRRPEDILREASRLVSGGARELNLVAQDTTSYGTDLPPETLLPDLLRKLCRLPGLQWIRLLYAHPDGLSEDLLEVMAGEKKILKYLDLPFQHSDASILRRMGRGGDGSGYLSLIDRIRSRLPDVTLRTTFITGFPGEGEREFRNLLRFLEEARFDRVGVFAYSREEGTPAGRMLPRVHRSTRQRRMRMLMEKQTAISLRKNLSFVGETLPVLVEGPAEGVMAPSMEGRVGKNRLWVGRSRRDAPEVDGCVFFVSGKPSIGKIINVRITGADAYDLTGEQLDDRQ
jgi:ribosomal protein S12 methylthiotransferase